MKKLLVTIAITASCVCAFAQGKVTFGNDSNHLITFSTDTGMLKSASTADATGLAGLAAPQVGSANPINLANFTAQLLAGTSASSLAPVSTVVAGLAGLADGRLANTPVTLTGIPAGTPAFFQVLVYETSAGSYANALNKYFAGQSPVFQVTPGSIVGPPIASPLAPGNSTWANGPITLTGLVPEPSTFALAGLGAAAMLIFRRRK